mgnify:CR=1 FL=1
MSEQSTEPWGIVDRNDQGDIYIGIGPGYYAIVPSFPWAEPPAATARRIVAAVNALQGVPTDALERWGVQQFQISTKAHYDGLEANLAEAKRLLRPFAALLLKGDEEWKDFTPVFQRGDNRITLAALRAARAFLDGAPCATTTPKSVCARWKRLRWPGPTSSSRTMPCRSGQSLGRSGQCLGCFSTTGRNQEHGDPLVRCTGVLRV